MPPNQQHSTILNCSLWKMSVHAHGVTGLRAISGTTAYRLALPPNRVGSKLHSISGRFKVRFGVACQSMPILALLFTRGGIKPTKPRGLVTGNKGVVLWDVGFGTWDTRGRFYNWTEWDHGGGHVGISSILGPVPNYVVLVISNEGGLHRHHTWVIGIILRKLH